MGNQQSTSTDNATSIRSKSSRRTRISIEEPPNRASRAVSFYQTPPGSFDTPRMSTSSPLPESPITSTGSNTPLRPLSMVSGQISRAASQAEPKPDSLEPVTEESKDTVKLVMKQKRTWRPGVYSLVNAKSGTAADLSGGDGRSIIGYPLHNGKNQQWNFESFGDGYTIRSVFSGLYLTVHDLPGEGVFLVASSYPVAWKVEDVSYEDITSIRILWPSGKYAFDLADGGSITPGTKVHLTLTNTDELSQRWNLVEREVSPIDVSCKRGSHLENSTSSSPLETVVVAEDKDHVITTRTTTTSTVTTVTTVTKTPKHPA